MVRIREEQRRKLTDIPFIERIAGLLRGRYGDTVITLPSGDIAIGAIPDIRLRELIATGIARARRHGMTWESSLGQFIFLMFIISPNFDSDPDVLPVLGDERIPSDERINALWNYVDDELFSAIRLDYDPAAWEMIEQPEPPRNQ
ncbi:MAG: hypothetical protein ABIQ57_17805 [Candidatus Kapaibacterium sp.]